MIFQGLGSSFLVIGAIASALPFSSATSSRFRRWRLREEISDRIGVKILSGEKANRVLTGWKVEHRMRALRDELKKAAGGAMGETDMNATLSNAYIELAPALSRLRGGSKCQLERLKAAAAPVEMAGFMARVIDRAIASHG